MIAKESNEYGTPTTTSYPYKKAPSIQTRPLKTKTQRNIYVLNRALKPKTPHFKILTKDKIISNQPIDYDYVLTLQKERDRLVQSNCELENVAAYAAHDLKSPINTSLGWLNLALARARNMDDRHLVEALTTIESNLKKSVYHINDVLNLVRHKTPIQIRSTCDMNILVQDVLRQISNDVNKPMIETKIHILPIIRANTHQLQCVISNIMGNSLKYRSLDRKLKLEIGYTEDKDNHEFFIADNGIGIAKTKLESVFYLFEKNYTCDSNQPSTGIGLAYCRKIINMHNGDIWAESNGCDGTVVKFTIPK
jgi:light-regulated signal transduction histidine kinase (bacteriophytochrome)